MKISIIIPLYNDAAHIARALQSVKNQNSVEDLETECIVVDDVSTDTGSIIVESFDSSIQNLTLIKSTTRRGPGGARNLGVEKATGDYILFLDSDDWLSETALSDISFAAKDSPDVIPLHYDTLVTGAPPKQFRKMCRDISDAVNTGVGPWTKVFKRDKYVRMPEGTLSEDTAWHFLLFDKFDTFGNVPEGSIQYYYDRTNTQAITDSASWAGTHSHTLEQLAFEDIMIKNGKNDRWISDILRNLANMYDIRHQLRKPWVKRSWAERFTREYQNMMTGHWIH